MRTSNRKQILIFSIFIILLAQISIDVFASNFRVSLGVLLLPILVYLYRSIAVLRVTVLAGFGVYLSRVFIRTLTAGVDSRAFADYYPELIFYIVYGCLFYLYFHKHDYKLPHPRCYVALFLMDYLANLSELLCRMGLDAFGVSLQFDIIVVALVRTLILWAVITGLSQYRFLLISTEHANRYQRLILLISKLNSEIIWMRKNSAMIEDAMAKSYRLYAQLQEQHASPELTQSALTVAKDIHEVKKEYVMILRGISEALELNLRDEVMSLSDILTVLGNAMTLLAEQNGKQVEFHIDIQRNFETDKHYFLLSVLRNLFTNAVEASQEENIVLGFAQTETELEYMFEISDNGPGIPVEDIKCVPLCRNHMVLITPATERYLRMQQRHASIQELLQEPIILREKGSRKSLDGLLDKLGLDERDLQIVARVGDPETVKNMVAGGMGVSLISEIAAKDFIKSRRLLEFELPQYRDAGSVCMIYPERYTPRDGAWHFIDYLNCMHR